MCVTTCEAAPVAVLCGCVVYVCDYLRGSTCSCAVWLRCVCVWLTTCEAAPVAVVCGCVVYVCDYLRGSTCSCGVWLCCVCVCSVDCLTCELIVKCVVIARNQSSLPAMLLTSLSVVCVVTCNLHHFCQFWVVMYWISSSSSRCGRNVEQHQIS